MRSPWPESPQVVALPRPPGTCATWSREAPDQGTDMPLLASSRMHEVAVRNSLMAAIQDRIGALIHPVRRVGSRCQRIHRRWRAGW